MNFASELALKFAARRFRNRKIEQLGGRTALEWFAGYLEALRAMPSDFLKQEIDEGTHLWELLPTNIKAYLQNDSSWWTDFVEKLSSEDAADLVHAGLAEKSPAVAEICTRQWLLDSIEEYKRYGRPG